MFRSRNTYSQNALMLSNTLRRLWIEHIVWSRNFIVSSVDELKDLEFVTNRLLRNPADFANVLIRYYGMQKAERFKNLLEAHLLIAADFVKYSKAKDTKEIDETRKRWYANADDISDFLSSINPYWDKREWQDMLYSHLKLLETLINDRINGNYEHEIATYEIYQNEALMMADYMFEGIRRQFGI